MFGVMYINAKLNDIFIYRIYIEKKLSLPFIEQNIYFTLSSADISADVYI